KTLAGAGVELQPKESATITLGRGQVLQAFTAGKFLSQQWAGSTVTANHPIQIITGSPCATIPNATLACDHLEETVLPAGALGTEYAVTVPRTPLGLAGTPNGGRHAVRIHGAAGGVKLTFDPPTISNTKSVAENGVLEILGVVDDFVVKGDRPFA